MNPRCELCDCENDKVDTYRYTICEECERKIFTMKEEDYKLKSFLQQIYAETVDDHVKMNIKRFFNENNYDFSENIYMDVYMRNNP